MLKIIKILEQTAFIDTNRQLSSPLGMSDLNKKDGKLEYNISEALYNITV